MKTFIAILIVAGAIYWFFFTGNDGDQPGEIGKDPQESGNVVNVPVTPKENEPKTVSELVRNNKINEAKALLEKTPEENRNLDWKIQLVEVEYALGNKPAALKNLEEVLIEAKAGRKPNLLWLKSKIQLSDGDKKAAGDTLYEIVNKHSDSDEAIEAAIKLQELWKSLLKSRDKNANIPKFNKVLSYIVENSLDMSVKEKVYKDLEKLNAKLFFSPNTYDGIISFHKVKFGENLEIIAKKYSIYDIRLVRTNKLPNKNMIRQNQELRVLHGRARVVVDRENFMMHFYLGDYFFKRYKVGTGKNDKTPAADTKVSKSRAVKPDFTDPETGKVYKFGSPDNPIGTRWIGLTMGNGYGIHGTLDATSVGKQSSNGCIRLRNEDVEELYDYIIQGDQVTID